MADVKPCKYGVETCMCCWCEKPCNMPGKTRTPGGWHLVRDGLPAEKGMYLVVVQSRYIWPEKKPWEYIVDIAESHVHGNSSNGVIDGFWCGSLYGWEYDEECHVAAWMDLTRVPHYIKELNDWREELEKDALEKEESTPNPSHPG